MSTAAPVVKCRVCNADTPADAARCSHCNAVQGDPGPCPHCRATAGASPNAEFRFVCDVCGGPRVPRAKDFSPSGREVAHLAVAERARKGRAMWRGLTVASGLVLPVLGLGWLVFALILGLSFTLVLLAAATLGPAALVFAYALSKARATSQKIAPALDAAWISVASDLAKTDAAVLSPPELARRLGIDETQAEELVAMLDVNAAVAPGPQRIAIPKSAGVTEVAEPDREALAEAEAASAATEIVERAKRAP